MANGPKLPESVMLSLDSKVEDLFTRLRNRFLGYQPGKRIVVGYTRDKSLPGMYEAASREEGSKPDISKIDRLVHIANTYIEATKERTKARLINEVESILHDYHHGRISDDDLDSAIDTQVHGILGKATLDVQNILGSEINKAKNLGILDGIISINAAQGIGDPTVVFLVVRDNVLCEECIRLHLLGDRTTPRAWKLSQVGSGYHKKGDPEPKLSGTHPMCRCQLSTVLPGYGFIDGRLRYIKPGYDLYSAQN